LIPGLGTAPVTEVPTFAVIAAGDEEVHVGLLLRTPVAGDACVLCVRLIHGLQGIFLMASPHLMRHLWGCRLGAFYLRGGNT